MAGDKCGLLRMPAAKADANSTVRNIRATIAADGSVKSSMSELLSGWTATVQRWSRRERG
jgi:hypothetical protein